MIAKTKLLTLINKGDAIDFYSMDREYYIGQWLDNQFVHALGRAQRFENIEDCVRAIEQSLRGML